MASIIKQAYDDMIAHIQAIHGDGSSPTLTDGANGFLFQYVAIYNNQLEDMLAGKTFEQDKPIVLIKMLPFQPKTLGFNVKQSDVTFQIFIGMEQEDAQDGTMDQNRDIYDLRDILIVKLTGFKPKNCNGLFQVNDEACAKHNNLYIYSTYFKCGFIDTKGSELDPDSGQNYWGPFPVPDNAQLEVDATLDKPIPNANQQIN